MNESYIVGTNPVSVKLSVQVGTAGVATTCVYLVGVQGKKKIAESNYDSGHISEIEIGQAPQLQNKNLQIHTSIDFSNGTPEIEKAQKNKIAITYSLQGGISGNKILKNDPNDIVYNENHIVKIIKLITLK